MLKNYFKTAWRNLWKNKTASGINIFGLAIGLTCCLLISLYIQQQLSFDKAEQKGDRIARVIMQYKFDGSDATGAGNFTSIRVATVFKKTFPEVEDAVKMIQLERVVHYNDKLISEKHFMFADQSYFNIFSKKLLQGNTNTALAARHDVVLTQSTAKKYFGDENPIGKSFQLSGDSNFYHITGIIADCPANSQIQFDFLASFSSLGISPEHESSYWGANYTTYLLLKNKGSIAQLQAKIPAFMKKEMEGKGATVNFLLEPFETIHLHSPYDSFVPNNNISYIYILAAVALLILIIACATYINLSTARSLERAKEVGVRKVIGAGKKQLFAQFIGESAIICIIAAALSLLAASLLLPLFNKLTNQELRTSNLYSIQFLTFSLLVAITVSFLAGAYPALVLTGFQPVKVLKGSFKNTGSGQMLRRSLTVFQFAISVFLIVSTFIVRQQLYYIQHKKLGYDKQHVIVLPMTNALVKNYAAIKQQFKQNPDVLNMSSCNRSPMGGGDGYAMRSATMPQNEQIAVSANPVDEEYIKTTGLQIIAGSDFTAQDIQNARIAQPNGDNIMQFIINESAAKQLGWTPQQAIGKKMFLDDPGYVKAVVKDFHFESLHNPIKPMVLFTRQFNSQLLVKLSGSNLLGTIAFLESKWKALVPDRPFEYRFLDEDYNKLYNAEITLGEIMDVFAGIAIVLACLGLFGLSAYNARQRIKETGIRKVLGATVYSIVVTLSKDFVVLTILSMVIAFPVAGWATTKWLQGFSYRTDVGWQIYVVAGIATVLLAVATVSYQGIKAALMNPVKSLKTE